MPAPISDQVIKRVKELCAENLTKSGRAIYLLYRQKFGAGQIGLRKVQEIVANVRRDFPEEPFPVIQWRPWENPNKNPEERAHLLLMDAVSVGVVGQHLNQHQAKWSINLRVALDELSSYDQFCFILLYAAREVNAYYLNEPEVYTSDLDAVLAHKPWLPENQRAYGLAVVTQLVPLPEIPGVQGLLDSQPLQDLRDVWHFARLSLEPPTRVWFPSGFIPDQLKAQWDTATEMIDALAAIWRGHNSIFPPVKVYEPVDDTLQTLRLRRSEQ